MENIDLHQMLSVLEAAAEEENERKQQELGQCRTQREEQERSVAENTARVRRLTAHGLEQERRLAGLQTAMDALDSALGVFRASSGRSSLGDTFRSNAQTIAALETQLYGSNGVHGKLEEVRNVIHDLQQRIATADVQRGGVAELNMELQELIMRQEELEQKETALFRDLGTIRSTNEILQGVSVSVNGEEFVITEMRSEKQRERDVLEREVQTTQHSIREASEELRAAQLQLTEILEREKTFTASGSGEQGGFFERARQLVESAQSTQGRMQREIFDLTSAEQDINVHLGEVTAVARQQRALIDGVLQRGDAVLRQQEGRIGAMHERMEHASSKISRTLDRLRETLGRDGGKNAAPLPAILQDIEAALREAEALEVNKDAIVAQGRDAVDGIRNVMSQAGIGGEEIRIEVLPSAEEGPVVSHDVEVIGTELALGFAGIELQSKVFEGTESRIQELQKQLEDHQAAMLELQREKAALSQEVDMLRDDKAELNGRLKRGHDEIVKLKDDLQRVTQHVKALEQQPSEEITLEDAFRTLRTYFEMTDPDNDVSLASDLTYLFDTSQMSLGKRRTRANMALLLQQLQHSQAAFDGVRNDLMELLRTGERQIVERYTYGQERACNMGDIFETIQKLLQSNTWLAKVCRAAGVQTARELVDLLDHPKVQTALGKAKK